MSNHGQFSQQRMLEGHVIDIFNNPGSDHQRLPPFGRFGKDIVDLNVSCEKRLIGTLNGEYTLTMNFKCVLILFLELELTGNTSLRFWKAHSRNNLTLGENRTIRGSGRRLKNWPKASEKF